MSSFNVSDLELLSNRKKLSKYFDKDKLSQSIQIENIISQINNISKNDQDMPLNLNLNNTLKNEIEILVNSYNKINEIVRNIKLTDGRFFIETFVNEIVEQAISKAKSVKYEELNNTKLVQLSSAK
jgi:phosphoglycerate-specific signal transduction histidine kinase